MGSRRAVKSFLIGLSSRFQSGCQVVFFGIGTSWVSRIRTVKCSTKSLFEAVSKRCGVARHRGGMDGKRCQKSLYYLILQRFFERKPTNYHFLLPRPSLFKKNLGPNPENYSMNRVFLENRALKLANKRRRFLIKALIELEFCSKN